MTTDDDRALAAAKALVAMGQREQAEVAASAAEVRAHYPTVAGFFSFLENAHEKFGVDSAAIRRYLVARADLVDALSRASMEFFVAPSNPFRIAESFRSVVDRLRAFESSGGRLDWTRLPSDALEAVTAIREERLDWQGTLFRVMADRIEAVHRLSETSASRAVKRKAVARAFWFGHKVWKALGRVANLRLVRGSFVTIKTPSAYETFERESVQRLRPNLQQQFAEQFFLVESAADQIASWKTILFFLSTLGYPMDEGTAVKLIESHGLPVKQGGRGRAATALKSALRAWVDRQAAALRELNEDDRELAADPKERARRADRRGIDGRIIAELAPGVFGSE